MRQLAITTRFKVEDLREAIKEVHGRVYVYMRVLGWVSLCIYVRLRVFVYLFVAPLCVCMANQAATSALMLTTQTKPHSRLKQMVKLAGVKGQPLVFLLTDSQVGSSVRSYTHTYRHGRCQPSDFD